MFMKDSGKVLSEDMRSDGSEKIHSSKLSVAAVGSTNVAYLSVNNLIITLHYRFFQTLECNQRSVKRTKKSQDIGPTMKRFTAFGITRQQKPCT